MRKRADKNRAFSIIEILIKTVIVMATGGVAAAVLAPSVSDAGRMQCRYNMITISNQIRVHRIKDPNHSYVTTLAELKPESPTVPVCPSGGTYSITISDGTVIAQNGRVVPAGTPIISCTCKEHGKYAADVDIN